jgi:hypothetical protein
MCPCNEGAQTSEHFNIWLQYTRSQRKTLKQLIQTSGGTWPTTNSDFVAKYLHAFLRFINSVDFHKLQ